MNINKQAKTAKKIKEYLELLPPAIAELALKNTETGDEIAYSVSDALSTAFIWRETPQGFGFWNDVHEWSRTLSGPAPKIPESKLSSRENELREEIDKLKLRIKQLEDLNRQLENNNRQIENKYRGSP